MPSISGHTIKIANKLEVRPGNIIMLPGCEPTSAFTSPTLHANQDCTSSFISLNDALAAIPGATVEFVTNGGGTVGTHRKLFTLPSGPPPSPGKCGTGAPQCIPDWYQILKDNATPLPANCDDAEEPTIDKLCEMFSIRYCGSKIF